MRMDIKTMEKDKMERKNGTPEKREVFYGYNSERSRSEMNKSGAHKSESLKSEAHKSEPRKSGKRFFLWYRTAEALTDRLKLWKRGGRNSQLAGELKDLHLGDAGQARAYYIRKIQLALTILSAGLLLSLSGLLMSVFEDREVAEQRLERPGYGEGARTENLEALVGDPSAPEMEETFPVTVHGRTYTEAEKKKLLEKAVEELTALVPGENDTLDEVRRDLVFPERLQGGAVLASWITSPYGVLDADGSILQAEEEEGILVEIQACLSCGEREMMHSFFARIYPPDRTEREQLLAAVTRKVREADERDAAKTSLQLPSSVDGKPVRWQYPSENSGALLAFLTLLCLALFWTGSDERIHQKAKERQQELTMDYPELLWKMVMLLGAGMTIRGSFQKMNMQYQSAARSGKRYLYEEIGVLCYEMNSGIPETQAYERFGRRCGNPEYIRLCSYLSQNLKKGAKGLQDFLETEAENAETLRRNQARKLGEQAGTRLLLPMVLMLGIVLAVLMVPAFMTM